jgi:hypothetical protein
MDHHWKGVLAQFLAEQGRSRQIVVFTHDLSFLYALKKHAHELSVSTVTHWIRNENGRPGFVYLNNSPAAEKDFRSAQKARECYAEAKGLAPERQQLALQQGFGYLRTSYEALVVFEVFRDVVARFEERINFGKLRDVRIDTELIEEIVTRFEDLSRFIDAHLHSDAFAAAKPTPEILFKEIEAFEQLKKRQAQLCKTAAKESQPKSVASPPAKEERQSPGTTPDPPDSRPN